MNERPKKDVKTAEEESSRTGVDASSVDLESLGNFGDLKNAKAGQDEAMRRVMEQSEKHE